MKRENKWKSRGLKQGAGWANLRKKEKTNGLVGAKTGVGGEGQPKKKEIMNGLVGAQNRGRGKPTEGKERKRIMKRGSKQRTGRANLRKREKTNGFL